MKTTIRGLLLGPLPAEAADLMRRYCAGVRFAYKRLVEGMRTLDVEKAVGATYTLNSRYAKDTVHEAAGLIAAQQELVKLRCREWQRKLAAAGHKLARARSPLKRAGLQAKVEKRRRKFAFWERHRQAGTHPPVVFGGRRAFHDRCAGKMSRDTLEEAVPDRRARRTVERLLALIVEVSTEIISMALVQAGKRPPGEYYRTFVAAGESGMIGADLSMELAPFAGLRNRLTHEYDRIDDERVYHNMHSALRLFPRFASEMTLFIG